MKLLLILLLFVEAQAQPKFTVSICLDELSDSFIYTGVRQDSTLNTKYMFVFEQRSLQDQNYFAYIYYEDNNMGVILGGVSKQFLLSIYPDLINGLKDMKTKIIKPKNDSDKEAGEVYQKQGSGTQTDNKKTSKPVEHKQGG